MSDDKTMTAEEIRDELVTALCREGMTTAAAMLGVMAHQLTERAEKAEAETEAIIEGIHRLFDSGPDAKPSICTWCGHTATSQGERRAHALICAKSPAVQRALAAEAALQPLAAWGAADQGADMVRDDEALVHLAGHLPITWGDVRRAAELLAPKTTQRSPTPEAALREEAGESPPAPPPLVHVDDGQGFQLKTRPGHTDAIPCPACVAFVADAPEGFNEAGEAADYHHFRAMAVPSPAAEPEVVDLVDEGPKGGGT